MIASQLRWLYHTLRCEFAQAAPHRRLVEEHAAVVGSVWQVETWQGASLLVVYSSMRDIVGSTRIVEELEAASRTVHSLKPYLRAARANLLLARGDVSDRALVERLFSDHLTQVPRMHVGWARLKANRARVHYLRGEYEDSKALCEEALGRVTDADRDYSAHFMPLELELAAADAALGRFDEAIARIDALRARFDHCDHALVLGTIHAMRAQVAYAAGDRDGFERSLAEVERWFVPTGAPTLIAQCNRLRELRSGAPYSRSIAPQGSDQTSETVIVNAAGDESSTVMFTSDESAPPATQSAPLVKALR
jgi:tetratricopeptide (TPR) repeat protein